VREDLALERIKAALGAAIESPADPTTVAEQLRSSGATITCTARTCSVDTRNRHAADDTVIVTGMIGSQAV